MHQTDLDLSIVLILTENLSAAEHNKVTVAHQRMYPKFFTLLDIPF